MTGSITPFVLAVLLTAPLAAQEAGLPAHAVDVEMLGSIVGKEVPVIGQVIKAKVTRRGDALILDFHQEWQSHLSIRIPAALFPDFPEPQQLVGKVIKVTGMVTEFKGQVGHFAVHKPEIILQSSNQLTVISNGSPPTPPTPTPHEH